MIYIYVEDKNEGFLLMKNAVNIYISNSNINVDTFNGIFNLENHLQNLSINENDKVYYIYDNVPGNTDIPSILKNTKKLIKQRDLQEQVYLMSILCCEYAILTADNIELFSYRNAIELIQKLKEYTVTPRLTTDTKNEPRFTELYDRARKDQEKKLIRKQKSKGVSYTKNDIEKAVTVEKLCKKMMTEVFPNELSITKELGDCWEKDCCIKKNRICSIDVKSSLLSNIEKKQFLVDKTVYIKIVTKIAEKEQLVIESLPQVDISTIYLIETVKRKIDRCKQSFKLNIAKCKYNLESHYDAGYTRKEAESMCKESGFSENEIRIAIRDTSYE